MNIYKKSNLVLVMVLFISNITVCFADTIYKVKPTDSLGAIAKKFYKDSDLDRHQIYVAILAENPHAFRLGNINKLKSKQILSIPSADELLAMEKEDAINLVAAHNNHVKKRKKTRLDPPFKDYTPKKVTKEKAAIGSLAKKQQATSEELERLSAETKELQERLEKLISNNEAMDSELNQLDELLTQ